MAEKHNPPGEDPGESQTRRGEDMQVDDGREAGRKDTGNEGATDRPTGSSTARDSTGIDPQDPIGDDGPDASKGGDPPDR